MKSFVVFISDKNKDILTEELLHAHVSYLKNLENSQNLVICGPCADNNSGVLVIRAVDISQAKKIIENDPFILKSYYRAYEIIEFIEANEKNNWLI